MKQQTLFMALLFLLAITVQAHQTSYQPPHQPPILKERLQYVTEKLNKDLQLTSTQKQQVVAAYTTFFAEMEKNKSKDAAMPPPPLVPKAIADKISSERDTKIKAALTATQYKKNVDLEKTLKPKHGMKPGENGPPKPPNG